MDDPFESHRKLQKMIEHSSGLNKLESLPNSISRMVEPLSERYTGALGAVVADFHQQQRFEKKLLLRYNVPTDLSRFEQSILATITGGAGSFTDAMRATQERIDAAVNAISTRADSVRLLDSVQQQFLKWAPSASNYALQAEIRGIAAVVEAMRPSSVASIAVSVDSWNNMLGDASDRSLRAAMLNPLIASARAVRYATTALAHTDDPLRVRAIEQSIALTDAQFRATADLVIDLEPVDETEDVSPRRRLLVPDRERLELLRRAAVVADLDVDTAAALIPTGQLYRVAHELLIVVSDINQRRLDAAEPLIFTPTQRVLRIYAELPLTLAVDRKTFADLIDNLYLLLYEAAGTDSLRYHVKGQGPLNDDECDIVFVVKRLRNHLRHDPERGTDADVRRKLKKVAADLQTRGFQGLPTAAGGYRRLHRILLEEAAAFVRTIHGRI